MKNLDGQVLLVLVSPTIIARGCHASKWLVSLLHVHDAGGPPYPWFTVAQKEFGKLKKWFIRFKMHAK